MVNILKQIEQDGSTLAKVEIVKNLDTYHQNLLKMIYEDCYGHQKYFIKKQPTLNGSGLDTIENDYIIFHEALKDLAKRNYTGNAAIDYITDILTLYDKEDQEFLIRILMKDLKIGLSKKGFENIFGVNNGDYTVSLANNLDKVKNVNVLDGTFYASRKLDGVRCVAIAEIVDRKVVSLELKSRQGKTFTTLDNLKPELQQLFLKLPDGIWILDGEVCIVDENGDEHFDWVMKEISRKNHTIKNPSYWLFDLISGDDFFSGRGETIFSQRLLILRSIYDLHASTNGSNYLRILGQELIESYADFDSWTNMVSTHNWEGFMLRKDVGYRGGRTNDLIKVKKFQDDEYVVIGYECGDVKYGTETYRDVVTNLHIVHKGNRVSVGSGISKEQRILWRKEPSKIIGKTITVQYFEETVDSKTGMFSLRFPVLKHVHGNKREV